MSLVGIILLGTETGHYMLHQRQICLFVKRIGVNFEALGPECLFRGKVAWRSGYRAVLLTGWGSLYSIWISFPCSLKKRLWEHLDTREGVFALGWDITFQAGE